jgi:hypothetical protein
MNNEKKDLIAELAGIAHDTEERYIMLGMMNSYGRTYEETKKARIDFAIAEAEMFEARAALRSAQEAI